MNTCMKSEIRKSKESKHRQQAAHWNWNFQDTPGRCLFAQGLSIFECLLSYTHQDDAGEQRDWKTMLLWKGSVVSGKLSNKLSQIKWDLPSNRLSEMVWTTTEYVMIWINESVNFEGPLKQFGKVCNCAEALCYNCTSGTFYGI